MTRTLYALRVPDAALEQPSSTQSLQVASNSPLNSDSPAVDSLAAEPGSRPLAGVVAGQYADIIAREFEELFSATGIEVVPWFGDTNNQRDAYVASRTSPSTKQPLKSRGCSASMGNSHKPGRKRITSERCTATRNRSTTRLVRPRRRR